MTINFNLGTEPRITIDAVAGDFRLVGWEHEEILIKTSDEESLSSRQDDTNSLVLSSSDDLSLNVPKNANVTIQKVSGDMSVRGLAGALDVNIIDGDVAIRDVGQVTIGTVESDFSLRTAKGDVHVKHVGGDASLRGVDGSISLDSVSDDLAIRGVGGSLKVDVDDDVVVHLDPKPDQKYSIIAGDDIMLVLPENANATLNLKGEHISVNYPGVVLGDSTSQVITLGEGAAKIDLDAGSRVLISTGEGAADSADEFGNFAGMMFDFGSWGREFGEHWGNWGQDFGERVSRKATEAAERAARKAEETARRMERHAEKQARNAEQQARHVHKAARKGAKFSWTFDSSKIPPGPKPTEPVSDEERITILKMLSEKKITSEQAEELLTALEGGK